MSLFDPEPYQIRTPRKPRQRPKERAIKLFRPWVVLRRRNQPPLAHLPYAVDAIADPMERRAMQEMLRKDGTPKAIPRCDPKHTFAILELDGHPLVPVCDKCAKYAEMNRIPMEMKERW